VPVALAAAAPIGYRLPITTPVAVVIVAVTLAVVAAAWRRRARAHERRRWEAAWGLPRARDRPMALIAEYHRIRRAASPSPDALDDRTGEDLHLDAVFTHLDRTASAPGQQLLYHRLRTAPAADRLDAFHALAVRLGDDPAARERLHAALTPLNETAAYHLCAIADAAPRVQRWHAVFPLLAAIMLVAIAAAPFWPLAMLVAICGVVLHFVVRMAVAGETGAVVAVFRQIAPLLHAADVAATLRSAGTDPILATLTRALPRLRLLRGFAAAAGRPAGGNELVEALFQYLNLLFLLDVNACYLGARELRRCSGALLDVVEAVGEADAAMAVASYRAGTAGWTRPRRLPPGSPVRITGVRHPLVEGAVGNDVALGPPAGLLLTGANMSGKSTLLRTIGITVVLAQTIDTCVAASYEAPVLRVRSLMGRADDLIAGKSYYRVEVEAVLDMVAAARGPVPHLFLFDELFRGTNTVERIAAGVAVLTALRAAPLGQAQHIIVAATHDRELVALLEGRYAAAHLSDAIGPDGIVFDYRLRDGPATTRNAIALLELSGAPDALVRDARALAAALDDARRPLANDG
jgi:hypothetical protein